MQKPVTLFLLATRLEIPPVLFLFPAKVFYMKAQVKAEVKRRRYPSLGRGMKNNFFIVVF